MSDQLSARNAADGTSGSIKNEPAQDDPAKRVTRYDFRRPDRIGKDQLRSIHSLHENFARSASSSLSAYLRTYVSSQLLSVDQLSFSEMVAARSAAPRCIVGLRMRPQEGSALLEIGNSIVFPIVEALLGGNGQDSKTIERDTTEIERTILDGVLRLLLKDLSAAWQTVAEIEFLPADYQNGPDLFRYLPPGEAMLSVSVELTLGQHKGQVIVSIPSIIVKMQRQRQNQQAKLKRGKRNDSDYERMLRLVQPARVDADVRLNGPSMLLKDLMNVTAGDVISLGYPVSRPLDLHLNGTRKFFGQVVSKGTKRGFQIADSADSLG